MENSFDTSAKVLAYAPRFFIKLESLDISLYNAASDLTNG